MPELPEVEVLVRHLGPRVRGARVRHVAILRERIVRPSTADAFRSLVEGRVIRNLGRRGKYLVFELEKARRETSGPFLCHLGMTGRLFLKDGDGPLHRHTAAVFDLGRDQLVLEDARLLGRLVGDGTPLDRLGPEPWEGRFPSEALADACGASRRPIKICLMDQSVVAGIGNIYAGEILFTAGISPLAPACRLLRADWERLGKAIRSVLSEAVDRGMAELKSTLSGAGALFYHGTSGAGTATPARNPFRVYDRMGKECLVCGTPIRRITQSGRSTFHCPVCQRTR